MKKEIFVKWVIVCVGLCVAFVLLLLSRQQEMEARFGDKSVVYREELGDLFSVTGLEPAEAEQILEAEVSEILTWEEILFVFDRLGYRALLTDLLPGTVEETQAVSRDEFMEVYEAFLKKIGVQSERICFAYYGHVPNTEELIADTGNYKIHLTEDFFTYGECYEAVSKGNQILFVTKVMVPSASVSLDLERSEGERDENKGADHVRDVSDESAAVNQTVSVRSNRIRVLLVNDNGGEPLRDAFQLRLGSAGSLSSGAKKQRYERGMVLCERDLASLFQESEVVLISPDKDGTIQLKWEDTKDWSPAYSGVFYIYKKDAQYWIVNQLPMEAYLCGVVPGEMPERFGLEALKAQAVCARTYAYNMLEQQTYQSYGADVDDSVNCQVYHKNGENKKTTQAVQETEGIVLMTTGEAPSVSSDLTLAKVYYFSTSCGYTTGMEAWDGDEVPYLQSVTTLRAGAGVSNWDTFLKDTSLDAYDSGSNYFRWKAELVLPDQQRLQIAERGDSGIVTKVIVSGPDGSQQICTENRIRRELGTYMTLLTDQNEKVQTGMTMLPSAWFTIEEAGGRYFLYGGGYGHGIGMSQYGANGMAKEGLSYEQILRYYFPGIILKEQN